MNDSHIKEIAVEIEKIEDPDARREAADAVYRAVSRYTRTFNKYVFYDACGIFAY